jgi:hypothetical protein
MHDYRTLHDQADRDAANTTDVGKSGFDGGCAGAACHALDL